MKDDDNSSDYDSTSNEVRTIAAMNPNEAIQYLGQTHSDIAKAAPNLSTDLFKNSLNAVLYLNAKLPNENHQMIADKPINPSKYEKDNWMKLYHTVNDPTIILDHAHNETLTNDQVEAVRSLYPNIYKEISNQVLMNLSESKQNGVTLPFKKNIMIAKLLGQPIDSSMDFPSLTSISTANSNVKSQENISNQTAVKSSNVKLLSDNDKMTATNIQSRGIKKLTGK